MSTFAFQQLVRFGLSTSGAAWVSSRVTIRSFNPKDILIPFGTSATDWYMVISGFVGTYMSTEGEANKEPFELFGPNAWIGLQLNAMPIELLPAYQSITAVELLVIPGQLIPKMLTQETAFASAVAQLTLARSARLTELRVVARKGSFAVQVFTALAHMIEDHARPSLRCAKDIPLQRCNVPLNQVELARLIGIARTRLSACLIALERAGLVNIQYGAIELLGCPLWLILLDQWRRQGFTNCNLEVGELTQLIRKLQTSHPVCRERDLRLDFNKEGTLPHCEVCHRGN